MNLKIGKQKWFHLKSKEKKYRRVNRAQWPVGVINPWTAVSSAHSQFSPHVNHTLLFYLPKDRILAALAASRRSTAHSIYSTLNQYIVNEWVRTVCRITCECEAIQILQSREMVNYLHLYDGTENFNFEEYWTMWEHSPDVVLNEDRKIHKDDLAFPYKLYLFIHSFNRCLFMLIIAKYYCPRC